MGPEHKIAHFITANGLLLSLIEMFSDRHCWLVGGCLRDLLVGRTPDDIDIACDQDPTVVAKAWARKISGSWFWLDKDRRQSRVVTSQGTTFDFTPLRAGSIAEDLQQRDFTINAFAYPLHKSTEDQVPVLLDPLGGITDLSNKVLRQCHGLSFAQDPLRMLKGVRHVVNLNLAFCPETLKRLKDCRALMSTVAGERIQTELAAIFAADDVLKWASLLMESSLLEIIFNTRKEGIDAEPFISSLAAFRRYLNAYGAADTFALMLAYLLDGFQVGDIDAIVGRRLKLSKKRQILITQILMRSEPAGPAKIVVKNLNLRQQALFFEYMQPCAMEKLVWYNFTNRFFSPQDISALSDAFTAVQSFNRVSHLLSGNEISALVNDVSGQDIGVLQAALKAAEMTGEIQTREDALDWLKQQNID